MKEGERIEVMVKEIRPEERKILLSLKDAGSDPWALIQEKFPKGAVIQGKVEKREAFGVFVELEPGVTGLLPKSRLAEQTDIVFERIRPGDALTVQVMEIKRDERKLTLDIPREGADEDWKHYKNTQTKSFGTMGGAFGDALKKAMDKKRT